MAPTKGVTPLRGNQGGSVWPSLCQHASFSAEIACKMRRLPPQRMLAAGAQPVSQAAFVMWRTVADWPLLCHGETFVWHAVMQ